MGEGGGRREGRKGREGGEGERERGRERGGRKDGRKEEVGGRIRSSAAESMTGPCPRVSSGSLTGVGPGDGMALSRASRNDLLLPSRKSSPSGPGGDGAALGDHLRVSFEGVRCGVVVHIVRASSNVHRRERG